jgi:sulfite reductase alpha subunit-like flavoprotein
VPFLPYKPIYHYSISSSPLIACSPYSATATTSTPRSLTIAFSVVDYITPSLKISANSSTDHDNNNINDGIEYGMRRIYGLATRYLEVISSALLCRQNDNRHNDDFSMLPKIKIFHKPTDEFRLPKSLQIPIILIGPGTGVAPFIGFLQHRKAQIMEQNNRQQDVNDDKKHSLKDETAPNNGSVDLFFGCRHKNHDWLYQKEMKELKDNQIITQLHTAFSRDCINGENYDNDGVLNHKYVQDIMKTSICCQRMADLILNHNASIYICGDGNQMAKDVQNTIIELLQQSTSTTSTIKNQQDAILYLNDMKVKQRLLLDIWS